MDGVGTLEAEGASAYCSTVSLLGQVIALHGTRIARERCRPRPDKDVIAALEQGRSAAVAACRTLHSADPDELDRVRDDYARRFLELLAGSSAVALRGARDPLGGAGPAVSSPGWTGRSRASAR